MNPTLEIQPRVLEVKGLTLRGPGGIPILNEISFGIESGKVLAVVGESGSGKTMAARAILRLLPQQIRWESGSIELEGQRIEGMGQRELRQLRGTKAGMIFQEPMISLNPVLSIGTQMMEALVLHQRISADEAYTRAISMLERVWIPDPQRCMAAYPHQFSGGMRQRIMLASAMLLKPKLLIADEPTTALDTLAQREVLELMMELTRTAGSSVLLITHNLGLVARYADTVLVLRKGNAVEAGTAREILKSPKAEYTRMLIEALPKRRTEPQISRSGTPVIAAQSISVHYPRTGLLNSEPPVQVVNEVSLSIRSGEIVALVGGSGSGKTTFGRSLIGLLPHSSGDVIFQGRPMNGATSELRRQFRLSCQLIFQDPYSSLDPRYRVGEIVDEPLRHVRGLSRGERRDIVAGMLEDVGLLDFAKRYPNALSGGQRQRVAIARALIRKPSFVVADEPVSALDMTIQKQILELLHRLQERNGFACLFISHDLAAVSQIADRVLVMNKGRLIEEGSVEEIMGRPQQYYTKDLVAAAPTMDTLGVKPGLAAVEA